MRDGLRRFYEEYLTFWFSSEGANPPVVAEKLRGMGSNQSKDNTTTYTIGDDQLIYRRYYR